MWQCTEDELVYLLTFMFEERGCLEVFQIPRNILINFLVSVKQKYKNNPYHNWRHSCYLIKKKKKKNSKKFLKFIFFSV